LWETHRLGLKPVKTPGGRGFAEILHGRIFIDNQTGQVSIIG